MLLKSIYRLLVVSSIGLFLSLPTLADEYPSGVVTLIAPYGQGGASDVHARIVSATAPSYLGQPIMVINKTGASGVIGSSFVVKAKKDGYTLLSARVGSQASVPALNSDIPYKWDDFTFIGLTERNPFVLAVPANSPFKSFNELKQAIKQGKRVSFSSAGTGTLLHLASLVMADSLKVPHQNLVHVPYKGGGKAKAAVIAGQVHMIWQNLSGVMEDILSGKLRALAITTGKRHNLLPQVPTVSELGHRDMEVIIGWSGIFGPPDLPRNITQRWIKVLSSLKKDKTFNKLIKNGGSLPDIRTPEETKAFVRRQYETFKKVAQKLKLNP